MDYGIQENHRKELTDNWAAVSAEVLLGGSFSVRYSDREYLNHLISEN